MAGIRVAVCRRYARVSGLRISRREIGKRMNRAAAREMLSTYLERPVTGVLAKMGVSPNMVTFAGLLGAGVSAWLISEGMLWAGGVVMLLAGVLDLFDGSLARSTGKESPFGALLDSVVDRVSEIVVLLGLLIHYARNDSLEGTVLVYLAVGGSVMVSYLRARSEGLGIDCKVGIMTRPERVAALGAGMIISHWFPAVMLVVLGIIAALTTLTTAQRLIHTGRSLSAGD
ncbi:MAG: CDP-alcohol phosphatidyltransferase family protein [Chloroflexi bacterium]|nr:CDP-alcohol phosphatidyltransferase family protein [Chloroflexota bacterium]